MNTDLEIEREDPIGTEPEVNEDFIEELEPEFDPNLIQLDESEDETKAIIEQWRSEAGVMSMEELPTFINHLIKDYNHDYGTICHALSIGSIATMWAMNRTPQGGITGFQAGAIMWENIINWMTEYKDKPLKLLNYGDLLYPQFEYKFNKTISKSTMVWLQEEARKSLVESEYAGTEVRNHWQSIVDGEVPLGFTIDED